MAFMKTEIRSDVLDINTTISVIYPEHVAPKREVPVLYLLHGYSGNHSDWMRQTALERYASQYQICVVMPSIHNSFYTNTIHGIDYFDFVAVELPKIIENMFHVSKNKKDRYVAGLSMGGYGALKVGLTFPERFHKIASFSGAFDIDRLYQADQNKKRRLLFDVIFDENPVKGTKHDIFHLLTVDQEKNDVPDLYIACGTEDFLYPDHQKLLSFLDDKKIPYDHLEVPGGHEWRLWDMFIEKALKWMFN